MDGATVATVARPLKKRPHVFNTTQAKRDHGLLLRLLRKFEQAAVADRPAIMRLALDFYDLHTRLEDGGLLKLHENAALQFMVELQEMTPPASRLYYSRGLDLKRYLEARVREEEQAYAESPAVEISAPADLLARYRQVRQSVQKALEAAPRQPTAGKLLAPLLPLLPSSCDSESLLMTC